MKPNPHDLINLPGYGNAEKALRKAGMWRDDPQKHIDNAIGALIAAGAHIERAMEATQ